LPSLKQPTAAQQIAATDPSQLRSCLAPLLRAGELGRSAAARGLAGCDKIWSMKIVKFASLLIPCASIFSGCSQPPQPEPETYWSGIYRERGQDMILDFDGMKLIFPGLLQKNFSGSS